MITNITGDEALYWAKKLIGEQAANLITKINTNSNEISKIDFSKAPIISTVGEDLDGYTDGGIWYFPATYAPANKPVDSGNVGFLIVIRAGTASRQAQFWVDNSSGGNVVYTRTNASNTPAWRDWKRIITDADLEPTIIDLTLNTLSSAITSLSIKATKSRNIVFVQIDCTLASELTTAFTAVSGGMPIPCITNGAFNFEATTYNVSGYTGKNLHITINSSGNLSLRFGGATRFVCSFTYIAKE